MCDRIIELEPGYGRAWALKALAQAYLFYGYNKGGENGVVAAQRALELDASLPEPYCVKARAAAAARNFADAENQVERALELAPDMWEVRNEAAATYIWQRKYREAIPHYEKCIELADDDRHSCDMLAMAYRALNDKLARGVRQRRCCSWRSQRSNEIPATARRSEAGPTLW